MKCEMPDKRQAVHDAIQRIGVLAAAELHRLGLEGDAFTYAADQCARHIDITYGVPAVLDGDKPYAMSEPNDSFRFSVVQINPRKFAVAGPTGRHVITVKSIRVAEQIKQAAESAFHSGWFAATMKHGASSPKLPVDPLE